LDRPTDPWSIEDERELAVLAKSDRAAFGILYDRYVQRIYGYCYRRLQTAEEAEDVTSLVFTRALTAMPRYRPDGPPFAAWLFAIAHNAVIDELRSKKSRPVSDPLPYEPPWETNEPGPETSVLVNEQTRELQAVLTQLSPEQARLIELRLAGLSDKEIAFVLGKSYGAVRVAQFRALGRLRELFGFPAKGQRDE
jgi:RNA polymerase sigma-70 factor (ECF subfamily)